MKEIIRNPQTLDDVLRVAQRIVKGGLGDGTVFGLGPNKDYYTLPSLYTKGNILVGTAAGPVVFPLGTSGQVFAVDTANTGGVEWTENHGLKNAVMNGGFDIWQRRTTTSTNGAYGADRWKLGTNGSVTAFTFSRQTLTPADFTGAVKEFFARLAVSNATGGGLTFLQNFVEDVRTMQGEVVTLSFWAKADAARVGLAQYTQVFGGGGSATVGPTSVGTFSATTTWQRFSFTFTMPSIVGKTIGTNHYMAILLGQNANGAHTFDFAQVQLERGGVATNFENRQFGMELALCKRYYEQSYAYGVAPGTVLLGPVICISTNGLAASTAGNVIAPLQLAFQVEKRIAPSTTPFDLDGTAGAVRVYTVDAKKTGASLVPTTQGMYPFLTFTNVSATAVAVGATICAHWTADADF